VDGVVKGDLHGESGIIIGNAGKVEGNVFASEVVLYGEIKGKIETQKLEMKKGSVLNGDIVVSNLITENGCVFNGHCSMNSNVQQNYSELSEIEQTS
jgi:cytoskeletal protein CcmA (bactofilin family)